MERNNVWTTYEESQLSELEKLCGKYRIFLDYGKTERECTTLTIQMAEAKGYINLEECMRNGRQLKAGDKVYAACMEKAVALFHIGRKPLSEGMNILGAHIDSPRLDVKQNPLYEEEELGYLDTHYYGGIKKYQWVTIPLALHGVIVKKDGTKAEIIIGEDEADPVFCITDLLVHLSSKQMEKRASLVIEGEKLNVLFGSIPLSEEGKKSVKECILAILEQKYGMEEADFLSAEIEVVPAGKSRECGIDRSMILGYGQDDRVCAFTSLTAMLDAKDPERTACCLLVDKEEIGSVGATGMRSKFFENTAAEILNLTGEYSDLILRRTLANSKMLSSDVSAAYDPLYPDVFEKKNTAFFANGIVFNKYNGSRGKSGTNDANAEYMAFIRKIMEENDVAFQTAELGKVDAGGGGTIAYILSLYGMQVIDCGVAVLSMHSPWEVTSKADIYEAKKGYEAFLSS